MSKDFRLFVSPELNNPSLQKTVNEEKISSSPILLLKPPPLSYIPVEDISSILGKLFEFVLEP
jgi:hypothetical protein